MSEFDKAASLFTDRLRYNVNWKSVYYGAAYSTRLRHAIAETRSACNDMEAFLDNEDKSHE